LAYGIHRAPKPPYYCKEKVMDYAFDCQNILILEGEEKEIHRFIEQAKDVCVDGDELYTTDFSFEKFIPTPHELPVVKPVNRQVSEALIEKYGCDNWPEWRLKNLGISSEPAETVFEKNKNKYTLRFLDEENLQKAICAISKQFPTLKLFLEYFSFTHHGKYTADYGKYEFVNGRMEEKETGPVLVLICPECGAIEKFEKIK